jgi:predicted SAM-dependent methyltransferase
MNNTMRTFAYACLLLISLPLRATDRDEIIHRGIWREGTPLRLHLGCGESKFDGYVNIDFPLSEHTVQTRPGADYFADITRLTFPDGSVDEIRSHHFFEHFERAQALAMLCTWHRWLKPNGLLIIETPDFEESIKLFTSGTCNYEQKQIILRHLYGSQEAFWAIHYDGWYLEKYKHILNALGFDVIMINQAGELIRNITIFAVKNRSLSPATLYNTGRQLLRFNMVAASEEVMMPVWIKSFDEFLSRSGQL